MAGTPVSLNAIVGLVQTGQLQAAIHACDTALQAEPDAPELLHLRGLLFTLSDQPAAAIPFINRAIGTRPQPKYWSNLGNALWATDRLDEAERAYRNAIALDEGFGDAWFNLGKLLLHTGRLPEAADALEHVTRINPDVRTWKMLGEAYGQLEQFMEARQAYERAFAASPRDPDIAALLADCLEKENRLEDARRMVETALAGHPEHYLGNMIMAILERRAGRAGEARARLLAMPDSSLPVRLQVQREHELGVLYDLANEYDSAYACFARAKSLQASIPSFGQADRDRYLSRLERLIELDYSWLAERRSPADDGMASPIFIVGFPRSGTTLLNQILNGHPQLHVMEETPLLGILEERLTEMQVAYPAGLATLPGEQARALRLEYFDLVRTAHPRWDGKRRLVDKLPLNISRLPLAALLFPESRVLLALRHPYDACLSGFMQLFSANDAMANFADLQSAALMYDRVFTLWEKLRASLPLPWMPVKYEDLVADPEAQLRSVMKFLGLPWTQALLDHTSTIGKRGRIKTPSYEQVARPIHRRSVGRWISYASHFESLTPLLLRHVEAWGYETTVPPEQRERDE